MNNNSPIIVALDGMDQRQALELARELSDLVWGFKVNDLLLEAGTSIIRTLKQYGRVFADPKLHDIPNTVANGIAQLDAAGADLITVHCSGGSEMLKFACRARKSAKILGVTVLTSLSDVGCENIYGHPADRIVTTLTKMALTTGIDGIVCSPKELSLLSELGSFLRVVPGIRPEGSSKDDQERTLTPKQAMEAGASLLVIGRPIIKAADPKEAAKGILAGINP